MVLLDTCTLLWWTLDPDKLSKKASKECLKIRKEKGYVSSISFWEIGIKIKKNKIEIPLSFESYVDKVKSINNLIIIPITEDIWVKNILLDWEHSDPADRTIVSTAIIYNIHIVTKDKIMKKYFKNTIW